MLARMRWGVEGFLDSTEATDLLDDVFVSTSLNLFEDRRVVPDAIQIEYTLNKAHNRRTFDELGLFMPRSIQFLRELCMQSSARLKAEKALRDRLPPEIIRMVGDVLIEMHGIPLRNFVEAWRQPRPRFNRNCLCENLTCSASTVARWMRSEHRWIVFHKQMNADAGLYGGGREARCQEDCKGHHDENFKPAKWTVVERLKVAKWSIGDENGNSAWPRMSPDLIEGVHGVNVWTP